MGNRQNVHKIGEIQENLLWYLGIASVMLLANNTHSPREIE
jgi:hypothetical protein